MLLVNVVPIFIVILPVLPLELLLVRLLLQRHEDPCFRIAPIVVASLASLLAAKEAHEGEQRCMPVAQVALPLPRGAYPGMPVEWPNQLLLLLLLQMLSLLGRRLLVAFEQGTHLGRIELALACLPLLEAHETEVVAAGTSDVMLHP